MSCSGAKTWARSCCKCAMKGKTVVSALTTMVLWGLLFPLVKLGFSACGVRSTADILLFAGVRFILCGGVICLWALCRAPASFRPAGRELMQILLTGLFAIVLHYAFSYLGLSSTDSGKTAILKQVGPLLYVCFSFLFFREDRPTAAKLLAAALGFLGILALNATARGVALGPGDLLILGASCCTVLSNVVGKKVFSRVAPVTVTGISQLFGGGVLLLAGLTMGGSMTLSGGALWLLGAICAASVVSYCLWYGIVKTGELSRLFIVKFAEPVFAGAFGALLLGEEIWKAQYLLAFGLIGAAVWLANRRT